MNQDFERKTLETSVKIESHQCEGRKQFMKYRNQDEALEWLVFIFSRKNFNLMGRVALPT